jgi:hypothetical protein
MRKLEAGKVLTLQFDGCCLVSYGHWLSSVHRSTAFYAKQGCKAKPMCCCPADVLFGHL